MWLTWSRRCLGKKQKQPSAPYDLEKIVGRRGRKQDVAVSLFVAHGVHQSNPPFKVEKQVTQV